VNIPAPQQSTPDVASPSGDGAVDAVYILMPAPLLMPCFSSAVEPKRCCSTVLPPSVCHSWVLVPRSGLGDRVTNAFTQEWQTLGGSTVLQQRFGST
jgi:hypothetical protein